jgi:hypothetical protein
LDRDVLDVIEREIDQEARARFPGTAVRQAVLLQYGDDPEIEPGDLWVRVLLDEPDGPEDNWEPALTAFEHASKTAREQFTSYLAETLREITLVEYTFSNNPVTCDGHGPRASNPVGAQLPDIQEREHPEATPVLARLGPAGPETLDTLIMAGTAATRAEAIRWALDRIREGPAYRRLRELRCEADRLKRRVLRASRKLRWPAARRSRNATDYGLRSFKAGSKDDFAGALPYVPGDEVQWRNRGIPGQVDRGAGGARLHPAHWFCCVSGELP